METNSEKSQLLEEELIRYGEKARNIMQALPKKLTGLSSAMLCTPEGFNVCSIGFQSKDIAKMAAVSSSLYAMADSVLSAFVGKKNSVSDTITVHSDNLDIIGKKIFLSNGETLVLIIASKNSQVGLQHYAAQFFETQLKKAFESL